MHGTHGEATINRTRLSATHGARPRIARSGLLEKFNSVLRARHALVHLKCVNDCCVEHEHFDPVDEAAGWFGEIQADFLEAAGEYLIA